jgi:hypothetical protein
MPTLRLLEHFKRVRAAARAACARSAAARVRASAVFQQSIELKLYRECLSAYYRMLPRPVLSAGPPFHEALRP